MNKMVSFRRRKKAAVGKSKLEAKEEKSKGKKKKQESAASKTVTPDKTRKKRPPSKATNALPRSVSKEHNSPLTTIAESHEETSSVVVRTPATEASVLNSVNVVTSSSLDESMEVVVGSASSKANTNLPNTYNEAMKSEPTVLLEQVHVFDKQNAKESDTEVVVSPDKMPNHDDIRKALFQEEDEEESDESLIKELDEIEGQQQQQVQEKRPVTPEEPPFDQSAQFGGAEDPAILALIARKEEEGPDQSSSAQNSITDNKSAPRSSIEDDNAPQGLFKSDVRNASMTKQLLAAFNCNTDTTSDEPPSCKGMSAFYDTMCVDVRGKRPFFSEEFSRDFVEDAVKDGIPLVFHFEAESDGSPEEPEWRGHSVTMFLRQGSYQGSQIVHPRLEWPTPEQQWTTEQPGTINLMDIHTISDSSEDDVRDDVEGSGTELMDLCFFSITSKYGDVYMFESGSPAERDWIVTGLKNVIVRLAYHLTVGDPSISSELFSAEYEYGSGDLPTLKTPVQAMNEITHAFLD